MIAPKCYQFVIVGNNLGLRRFLNHNGGQIIITAKIILYCNITG